MDTVFGGVGMITQLAFLDLAAKSCPRRVEATFFALLKSVFNGGTQSSQVVGGYLYDGLGYTSLVRKPAGSAVRRGGDPRVAGLPFRTMRMELKRPPQNAGTRGPPLRAQGGSDFDLDRLVTPRGGGRFTFEVIRGADKWATRA